MAVLMYLVGLSIVVVTELLGVNTVPAGPVHTVFTHTVFTHTVFTITGTSIAELNSTVQVSVCEDPTNTVPGSVTLTKVGIGTVAHKNHKDVIKFMNQAL